MGNTFKLGKLVNGLNVLDNGNVGIGTSSPGRQVEIYNATDAYLKFNGQRVGNIAYTIGSDTIGFIIYDDTNGAYKFVIKQNGNVGIATTSPQRTLDVRGHLSVGSTTPTVSGSGYADIHLRTFSGATNSPARIQVVDNWFDLYSTYTDGYRLRNYSSDGVVRSLVEISGDGNFTVKGGQLGIDSGVTGTAGMFIKSEGTTTTGFTNIQGFHSNVAYNSNLILQRYGGNIGIGTTDVVSTNLVGALTIRKSYNGDTPNGATTQGYYANQSALFLFGRNSGVTIVSNNNEEGSIIFGNNSTNAYASIVTGSGGSATGGDMYFRVGGNAERMRIYSNGNISVGTSTNTYRFQIAKVSQAAPALMISGAYYGGPRIQTYGLDADSNAWMGLGTDMSGAAYEHSLYYSTNGRQTIGSYDGSTYTTRFYILANGNYWFSGSNLSDVRLKENIQPISLTASEKIALLNPCSYNMKDDLSITKYGFIAQEVQDVLPDLIRGGSDKHEDFMGLDYDGIFTITVKAVQEILTRLTVLENK